MERSFIAGSRVPRERSPECFVSFCRKLIVEVLDDDDDGVIVLSEDDAEPSVKVSFIVEADKVAVPRDESRPPERRDPRNAAVVPDSAPHLEVCFHGIKRAMS